MLTAAQWEDVMLGRVLVGLLAMGVLVAYLAAEWQWSEPHRRERGMR